MSITFCVVRIVTCFTVVFHLRNLQFISRLAWLLVLLWLSQLRTLPLVTCLMWLLVLPWLSQLRTLPLVSYVA
jgi:hypothetical protein